MPVELRPLKIKGQQSGYGGGFYTPIWGGNTSYWYSQPGGESAPRLDARDNIYYGNLIKKATGLDKFTFELQNLDQALNQEDSLGAIANIWTAVGKGFDLKIVNYDFVKEDVYFRNQLINYAKADELQQKLNIMSKDAIEKALQASTANNTIHDIGTYTLSGGAFSGAKAFAHYLWGDGKNLNVNINNLGLKLDATKIPLLSQTIKHNKEAGQIHIDTSFAYNTGDDAFRTFTYLGNITLRVEGDFNKHANGAWSFDGTAKAYQDRYDFNEASRGLAAETLTTFGRVAKGTTYNIDITGESKISLVGFGNHAEYH
ncbi:lipid II-degrading bacteriocin [Pseudomonas sp. TNT2022 ID357]|uniref:Lipid II-degrading bacteriocin n=1 Tax=Pseudomonas idahonensis TaxID=2942628 RepID=A0ABT5Q3Q8_9PSED|nr:lipid II-degrading bacteriocin [Pseudomonas idahonensis]MDD1148833.1 lipid II-degrading bacteriocin [Pseudomonas idahonensis]